MMFLFCSVSKQHFNEFAFSLYDRDGSHSLESDEIDEMISACYGAHWKSRPKVVKMVSTLSENGEINLNDWENILKKHPFLLFPAFSVQKTLRERTFGTSFWKKKAKDRLKSHGKEFAAQQALLAKLVAAPGEYKRKDGFDLDDLLAEEDKKDTEDSDDDLFVKFKTNEKIKPKKKGQRAAIRGNKYKYCGKIKNFKLLNKPVKKVSEKKKMDFSSWKTMFKN